MEDIKKRKVEDEEGKVANGSGGLVLTTPHEDFRFSTRKMRMEAREEATNDTSYRTATTQEYLRSLLDPLNKSQLVDLLSRLGSQNPSIAEEIKGLASADPVHRKLFVRGLAWNTTSETLCDAFREHGEIEEGAVISDKATGKSRGYGFITYKYMESAKRALAAPSKLIDGRMAVCNLACEGLNASSATPDLAQRKLYIGGLAPEITSEILLDFFARHGVIEEGSVAYDKDTNESRGFGFVTYKTVEAARKAIDDPQKMLGGRTVTVKFADSHRGKTMHNQLPASMGPVGLPMTAGYSQPGKAHAGAAPVGYTYPHTMAPYPTSSYPASSYPASSVPSPPAAPYQSHSQMSYAPAASKKEPLGASLPPPMGMGGYPYYHPKQ